MFDQIDIDVGVVRPGNVLLDIEQFNEIGEDGLLQSFGGGLRRTKRIPAYLSF